MDAKERHGYLEAYHKKTWSFFSVKIYLGLANFTVYFMYIDYYNNICMNK